MCLNVKFIVKMVKKLFLAADLGHISRVQSQGPGQWLWLSNTPGWAKSCYDSSTCLLICFLLFNYVPFICFSIFFSSCAALLFIHGLMHSMLTHAQYAYSCTVLHSSAQSCMVCLLMHSLLRCSLITQYIRTVWTVVFCS